ncbi:chemotaxis protein CheW [Dethiosulfovibrio salsuginis]|uniref:CheW-like domain-containing protein n=1 Tax=Dethiosulfovibrio salsuginis TaxID=561720 RepID=A0A1X7K3Q7_9BACT|nr:chemotaxis protein CheW [Dethiosulfovibrio salsuginis]SMG35236.1 CheW-like domain-containing protein [Dethiosulfovibrio salsuginis]
MDSYLIFYVGSRTLALPVKEVDRIVPSVAMTPLNEPHPIVAGIIDVEGRGVLLYDLRPVYGEELSPLKLEHRFILITWQDRPRALWVDGIRDVTQLSTDPVNLPGSSKKASMVFQNDRTAISTTSSEEIMEMAERCGLELP